MERASKFIRELQLPDESISVEQLACANWAPAVGKKISSHTRAVRMVRRRLVVEVEDAVWQRQLFALTGQILRALQKHLGSGVVEDLEFRVMPRRIEPNRAAAAVPTKAVDEADGIADPILRSLYKTSRKRSLA